MKFSNRLILGFGLVLFCLIGMTLLPLFVANDQWLIATVGVAACLFSFACAWWAIQGAIRPLRKSIAIAKRVAASDLTEPIIVRAAGDLGDLEHALQEISGRIFKVVTDVRSGTAIVATTSGHISSDSDALSERTESAASSLEETASAMEELTSTVRQNAENAKQVNKLAALATDSASKGGQVVATVIDTMSVIKGSSGKIVDIISVIDGIAFQTNILALNAAVEAARAGEQGRGFAVVAAEVRTLAQRSATAAKEIKGLIIDSVEKVDTGSQLVDEASEAMTEIGTSVKRLVGIMNEIAGASAQQSVGIDEINRSIIQLDGMTQQNARLVDEAARAAAALHEQAVALSETVAVFSLGAREYGSAEEAVEMVKQGIEFIRQHGEDGILQEVNMLNKGQFIDRDLYLSIYSLEGKCLAHGTNRRLLGVGSETFKDLDGKFFIKDIISGAKSAGSGWVRYRWSHPVTKEPMAKEVYYEKAGNLILGCGSWHR